MANELTISATFAFTDGVTELFERTLSEITANSSNKKMVHVIASIGTAEEAMQLGETSGALGYCLIRNLDGTHFVEVRAATAGTKIVKILAGKFALFQFGSGVTAPFIIADTGACSVEYVIVST